MPFVRVRGLPGLVFVPDAPCKRKRKHPCPDCSSCQMCGEERCRLCRRRRRK